MLLPAAKGRGQYYYGGFSLGSGAFEYALATDPASNGGAYADVKLLSDSEHNGVMEVHFSMLRGSPGFYSTAIMTHRKQDVKFEVGAWGVVTRVTPAFNWLSADAARNFFIGERSKNGVKVPDCAAREHDPARRRSAGPVRQQVHLRAGPRGPPRLGMEQRRPGRLEHRRLDDDEHGVQRRRPAEARCLGLSVQ